jgi:hypothetical protein
METVQLQCGNCGKVMAISTEHLGGQVRCPHCQSVVQTPPRQPPAPVPLPAATLAPQLESREGESIFAPDEPSDDLFGERPQQNHVEMPPDNPPPEPPHYAADAAPQETVGVFAGAPPAPQADAESTEDEAAQLSSFRRPRPMVDRSYVSLMAFMFLIPYTVLSTAIVVYLMYQLSSQPHPLDVMPDPVKDKGKGVPREVERIKHDQPLAAHQKVPLGKEIVVGALQVTPKEVVFDHEFGELRLVLHVKNVSTNQAFSPMHPNFIKFTPGLKASMPYSFLKSNSAKFRPIYDEQLAFKRPGDAELSGEDKSELLPGEEEDLLLTTRGNKDMVKNIVASNEDMTWRVQLRRGFVDHRGHKVSATAVVGVQFNASEIRKG